MNSHPQFDLDPTNPRWMTSSYNTHTGHEHTSTDGMNVWDWQHGLAEPYNAIEDADHCNKLGAPHSLLAAAGHERCWLCYESLQTAGN